MTNILDLLRRDHTQIRRLLGAFESELERFVAAGDADYQILSSGLEYGIRYLDTVHHPLEERMLELMGDREARWTAGSISKLPHEHEDLSRLTRETAAAFESAMYDATAQRAELERLGRNLLKAYRAHLEWEERDPFKVAERILRDEDWDKLEDAWRLLNDQAKNHAGAETYAMLTDFVAGLDNT